MKIVKVQFFNARLTGFVVNDKSYEYATNDDSIEVDDVVLAGAYQTPAIVTRVIGTNAEDLPLTHKNKKTGKETPLIQNSGMNVDIYVKTLTDAVKNQE